MERKTMQIVVGNEEIIFETGKIAKQANGAVLVRSGETIIFTSACAKLEPVEEKQDFLPLQVIYQEKFSSAGKTLGGFIKREGRPSEKDILVSRLIDRPIRPMFEEGYCNETQVLSYVWSYDGVNSPEPLAICAASAALVISDIPLIKPIGAVRVGYVDGNYILNPTVEQQECSKLDLIIAGTKEAVTMIEGYCNFLTEEQVIEAIEEGHKGIKTICEALEKWQKEVGKPKNRVTLLQPQTEALEAVENYAAPLLLKALEIGDKLQREAAVKEIENSLVNKFCAEDNPVYGVTDVKMAFKKVAARHMRNKILKDGIRVDGRRPDEIRPIDIEQAILPRVHGCSLFTRGETQTMAVCTLGGESMGQRFEDLGGDGLRRFYMQYFFPPFSVGEVGRMGPPGRREIGHGKLAERALQAILPSRDDFPYTIRLESNITESNGSSSMASVCGGCLALMEAGVPIKRPVSGIAMGLILEGDEFVILSDILGIEDHLGDMDFKVTGDREGITAFQMDIKIEGITIDIMRQALDQAKAGRIHILEKMLAVCPSSKPEMSKYAPRIETIRVKPSKIATIIGPGGKQIRKIIEDTGVEVDIDDEGIVNLTSNDKEGIEKARKIILALIAEAEVGKIYEGRVTSVMPFGIFVEILPGKEGLCHISEFDTMRIDNLNKHVKEGDTVRVKVLDINDRGQIKLSRKVLLLKQNRRS